MSQTEREQLRAFYADQQRWYQAREAEVGARRAQAEMGRRIWEEAHRRGIRLTVQTPEELRALGARVRPAAPVPTRPAARPILGVQPSSSPPRRAPESQVARPSYLDGFSAGVARGLSDGFAEVDTAVRSAANLLTWDGANHFSAGMNALFQPRERGPYWERYRRNLADEDARTLDDETNRPGAVAAGQLGGTALAFARGGPVAVVRDPKRIRGTAKATWRDHLGLLLGGAIVGAGTQIASDIVTNDRSSPGDMGGAVIGGISGVAARRLGIGRAAAIDGWTTSMAQDALNGLAPSLSRAGQSSVVGRGVGEVISGIASRASNRLSNRDKRRLGELLGRTRATFAGRRPEYGPATPVPVGAGRFSIPDDQLGQIINEYKFGRHARLTDNQKLAQTLHGDNYALYHFLPEDIGGIFGIPGGGVAPHLLPEWE